MRDYGSVQPFVVATSELGANPIRQTVRDCLATFHPRGSPRQFPLVIHISFHCCSSPLLLGCRSHSAAFCPAKISSQAPPGPPAVRAIELPALVVTDDFLGLVASRLNPTDHNPRRGQHARCEVPLVLL